MDYKSALDEQRMKEHAKRILALEQELTALRVKTPESAHKYELVTELIDRLNSNKPISDSEYFICVMLENLEQDVINIIKEQIESLNQLSKQTGPEQAIGIAFAIAELAKVLKFTS